jgi:hypothetical protein
MRKSTKMDRVRPVTMWCLKSLLLLPLWMMAMGWGIGCAAPSENEPMYQPMTIQGHPVNYVTPTHERSNKPLPDKK